MTTKILYAMLALVVFASGLGVGTLFGTLSNDVILESQSVSHRGLQFETVRAEPTVSEKSLTPIAQPVQLDTARNRASPSDWIKESQIEMRADGVFIKLNNPQWAIFADTKSMDPVFDSTSHAIQEIPTNKEDIHVGDIISYSAPNGYSIIHRVIEISQDEEGWYAIVKGDNNPTPDPWKIRWNMVTRVTVALIY